MSLPELQMPRQVIRATKTFVTHEYPYGLFPANAFVLKRILKP